MWAVIGELDRFVTESSETLEFSIGAWKVSSQGTMQHSPNVRCNDYALVYFWGPRHVLLGFLNKAMHVRVDLPQAQSLLAHVAKSRFKHGRDGVDRI